jgi:hypothetical protein
MADCIVYGVSIWTEEVEAGSVTMTTKWWGEKDGDWEKL